VIESKVRVAIMSIAYKQSIDFWAKMLGINGGIGSTNNA